MSDHDAREDYDDDPATGPLAPEHLVRWPASMMWVFGMMQLLIVQLHIAFVITMLVFTHFIDDDKSISELAQTIGNNAALWISFLAWPILTACTLIVMIGANGLRRFRRYRLVVVGAVLTCMAIPFVFMVIVQLPLGLWIIFLLMRRDVRARFESVECGKMQVNP